MRNVNGVGSTSNGSSVLDIETVEKYLQSVDIDVVFGEVIDLSFPLHGAKRVAGTTCMLHFHLNYMFTATYSPDFKFQVIDGEGQVVFELTEGLDSFPNRQNTLNERLVVGYNDQTKLRLTKADVEITAFTIMKGSFYTVSVF